MPGNQVVGPVLVQAARKAGVLCVLRTRPDGALRPHPVLMRLPLRGSTLMPVGTPFGRAAVATCRGMPRCTRVGPTGGGMRSSVDRTPGAIGGARPAHMYRRAGPADVAAGMARHLRRMDEVRGGPAEMRDPAAAHSRRGADVAPKPAASHPGRGMEAAAAEPAPAMEAAAPAESSRVAASATSAMTATTAAELRLRGARQHRPGQQKDRREGNG
jgi:hypothetical protein